MKKKRQLGDLIRASRETSGLSQRELGRRVGVTASHVAYIEGGTRRPSHTLLLRLSRSLQLNREELIAAAYPELVVLLPPPTWNREAAWRRFVALSGRFSVTPRELEVLRKISRVAKISSPNSYFWILNSIRQSLEDD
jgi:transcriptional regulator with XRE-family HTH domain